jgi:hypothetical protein
MSVSNEDLAQAKQELEAALQKWVRVSRDNDENFFIQDYSIAVSSESMAPGLENMTYMNFFNRPGMPGYQVVGLLRMAEHYWLGSNDRG